MNAFFRYQKQKKFQFNASSEMSQSQDMPLNSHDSQFFARYTELLLLRRRIYIGLR